MAGREKKEGKTNIQKFEYLEKEKGFLDEIKKTFFTVFKGLQFLKNKNLIENSRHKL